MKDIVIIGAGGFGREVAWLIEDINRVKNEWNVLGFVDDNEDIIGQEINGYKVLGNIEWLKKQNLYVVNAIGNSLVRKKIMEDLKSSKNQYPILIHPNVIVSNRVEIGEGSIICPNCIVSTNTKVGRHVIIDFGTIIGHDAVVDSYVTLFPSVNISGFSHLKECVHMGVKSVVLQELTIGENTIVGAGAVVVKSIPSSCIAVGVPAKPIK